MAIQPSLVQYYWSELRRKRVEVGRLYDDGFLYLKDDPRVWVESNHDSVSSVRSLELDLWFYKGERIGDSIGELSQLTHLSIYGGFCNLKCLPNTLSRLHNLHHLELYGCDKLEDLPPILGDLYNLTYLSLKPCHSLKLIESVAKLSNLTTLVISRLKELPPNLGGLYNLKSLSLEDCHNYVIQSVTKLSNLTTLTICDYGKLQELPANLGDLKFLASLFLNGCFSLRCLPWSITKLSNLRILYLTREFRIETLPLHLNDSIIISVGHAHIRKTWKELKTQITEFPIITEELAAKKTSTHGYLQFKGDPTLWIRDYNNYGLLSSLRVLDLDLGDWSCKGKIPDSIGELPQLTHLYISNGCLPHHLPPTFSRLMHVSLIKYTFERDTKSHFDSLENLSTLTSLHLNPSYDKLLPEHMDLPISLTHLTLECDPMYSSILDSDSYMASMANLSNLNTLTLFRCGDLESLPLHLNLTKLILRNTTIKSLPIGLKHLEIIHSICRGELCNKLQECWRNQLVNLGTLSCTCYAIKSLSSVTSLHNLRELQLKDCFSLQELPQDLHKLVNLCTLNVSGTRIQSLPNSIINLHNLRRLILPKCFKLHTLPPDFEKKVRISVDDTDESYYQCKGYHNPDYGIINDCGYMSSDFIKKINKKFLAKFKPDATVTVIEQASQHRPSNHQPDATQIIEAFNTDISNFPYRNNIPAVIMDNLVGWKDVEADGNCGFRCVAEVFHGGQENWPMARRAILNELKAHPDVYQKIYRDDYDSALKRIDRNDGQCGEDYYMEIVSDLFPIANCHQCPVICFFVTNDGLNPQLSATVLPWNVGAHSTRPTKELTIAHLGTYKHYILLDLKDDFPVPPISRLWYDIIDKTVVDWDSPYVTRRQRWDRLTNRSRDSTHLDVIDDSNANGRNNAVGENISHTNSSSHNHETNLSRENSQLAFPNGGIDNNNLELEQGTSSSDSPNYAHGGSDNHALVKRRNKNPQGGNVKHNNQKIEISLERIMELKSQNMTVEEAAKHIGDKGVSKSTLKRSLVQNKISWPRKNPDKSRNKTHSAKSSIAVDASNPASHGQGVEHSARPSQPTLSYHVPSERNVVNNNSIPDVVRRTEFEVKATYDEDTVCFRFSWSSSFKLLEKKVANRFELEVGKFKMYYHDETEWILVRYLSDLERALQFSRPSESNVVRLSIFVKE